MKNNFIPYEHAKMMKELGFNYPCPYYYNHKGEDKIEDLYHTEISNSEIDQSGYDAPYVSKPLYQQAEEWLWEKRGFYFVIGQTKSSGFYFKIKEIKCLHNECHGYKSPIHAYREGILKAIEYLHSQKK